jgi:hypothetical protein
MVAVFCDEFQALAASILTRAAQRAAGGRNPATSEEQK